MRRPAKIVGILSLAAACAGPGAVQRRALDELYALGDYSAAVESLRGARDEYGPSNEVAYRLDLGLALLDSGRAAEADEELARAQGRMEALWTLSLSKLAGAVLANENVDDYRGEDFERAFSHALRALGLAQRGLTDSALVEARRVEAFLDEQARSFPRSRTYRDDAFARWLAARLYEDRGKPDDARISDEAAGGAYASWAAAYGTAPPRPAAGEGPAELAVIVLEGAAPRKERVSGGGPLGAFLQTSYPAYVAPPRRTVAVELVAGGLVAEGDVVLDLAVVAAKDLEERLAALKTRSAARAAAKLALSAVGVDARQSEFADIRRWANLPARLRSARLRLPPGPVHARLRCLDAQGRELRSVGLAAELVAGGRAWRLARCP
jgi:hypothetical protein